VISIVEGAHTGGGLVIVIKGEPGASITTGADSPEVQPAEFVTEKL
jgi:hypothetical protein